MAGIYGLRSEGKEVNKFEVSPAVLVLRVLASLPVCIAYF